MFIALACLISTAAGTSLLCGGLGAPEGPTSPEEMGFVHFFIHLLHRFISGALRHMHETGWTSQPARFPGLSELTV